MLYLVTFLVGLFIGGGAFALALRQMRRPREEAPRGAPKPLRRNSMPISRERTQEALLAAFRPDAMPEPEDVLREDQRILADALREIVKRRGAVAAVLWVIDTIHGGIACPVASSADEERSSASPAFVPVIASTDRELVEWAAREKQLTFDANEPTRLAVMPLEAFDLPGALSLHFDERSTVTREAMRDWMPHHARMMQSWYTLVRTRADVARQNFRLRGLIRTAGTLQATRDPLELERILVNDVLTVAGAEWAVLVRWDGVNEVGEIRAATDSAVQLGIDVERTRVGAETLVGDVCIGGRPAVHVDARALVRGEELVFGGRSRLGPVGSLLIVPLTRDDKPPAVGAIVCGHRDLAALRVPDARNARNLGVIAAGALETAWAVEDARRNARTDPLTGLANRRGFQERFEQVVAETDRYGGAAALILLDIDYFKKVNDTYGHEAGDLVLVAVANSIADGRRTVDSVARLGGEEMAILLPQTDANGAREVAERLRQRIEATTVRTPMAEVRVTASFGIAEYEARAGDGAKVLERADQALYAAKRNGRNLVEVA